MRTWRPSQQGDEDVGCYIKKCASPKCVKCSGETFSWAKPVLFHDLDEELGQVAFRRNRSSRRLITEADRGFVSSVLVAIVIPVNNTASNHSFGTTVFSWSLDLESTILVTWNLRLERSLMWTKSLISVRKVRLLPTIWTVEEFKFGATLQLIFFRIGSPESRRWPANSSTCMTISKSRAMEPLFVNTQPFISRSFRETGLEFHKPFRPSKRNGFTF